MNFGKAILLYKLAEVLDFPPSHEVTSHFPFSNNQQNWKYKHKDGKLSLKNGETIYSFSFPDKLVPDKEEDNHSFEIKRLNDNNYSNIATHERTAQVHRSHPGQLYITLHEGKRNPTYTLKHQNENVWKAILKKKINKQIKDLIAEQVDINKTANIYSGAVNTFNNFTNLPAPVVAGGAMGASYLLNKNRKDNDPFDVQHPLVSKLMDYGIPLATIMALYYGGKGALTPAASASFSPV